MPTSVGFLDQVQVTREYGFLMIMTAVGTGIRCGYDYSAYIYEWGEQLAAGLGERAERLYEIPAGARATAAGYGDGKLLDKLEQMLQ